MDKHKRLKVVHFHRKPYSNHHSIERVFDTVRRFLPPDIQCNVHICRYISRGLFRRIYNILEAFTKQSEINHITGDISYISLLLDTKRTMLTIHDCNLYYRLHGWKKYIVSLIWYNLPCRKSAIITTISEYQKREIEALVPAARGKVCVISDPIPPGYLPHPKMSFPEKPIILQVGTAYNKNLERVVESLTDLPCRLWIVGNLSVEQERLLSKSGLEYENFSNLSDEEMLDKYLKCDLLIFASTYEGFGMPIIEANAIGRPVITSKLDPMTEVAGDAACFVDPFDQSSIREGIQKVISDKQLRESIIQNGYKNAKRFAAEEIAKKYALKYWELYHKYMKETPR